MGLSEESVCSSLAGHGYVRECVYSTGGVCAVEYLVQAVHAYLHVMRYVFGHVYVCDKERKGGRVSVLIYMWMR